jgi:hypothetical protein
VYRLRKRAEIRRQIHDRKSVQEGKPDRIADLLEEAADALSERTWVGLTDDERSKIWGELPQTSNEERDACIFAQDIEAKLKEKNT